MTTQKRRQTAIIQRMWADFGQSYGDCNTENSMCTEDDIMTILKSLIKVQIETSAKNILYIKWGFRENIFQQNVSSL